MKVGIIGAGNIGSALGGHFRKLQHTVLIANSRGPETLAQVAEKTGATPVTISEVAKRVDLLVITIPMKRVPLLPKEMLADLPATSPIVDTGNYYPLRDGVISELKGGMTESEWTSHVLGRPVIKAFNNILTDSLLTKLFRKVRRIGSLYRYQGMTTGPSGSLWRCSMRWASMPLMQARSPNLGATSPGRRRTALMQRSDSCPCC